MRASPSEGAIGWPERLVHTGLALAVVAFSVLLRPPVELGESSQLGTAAIAVVVILLVVLLTTYVFGRFPAAKYSPAWVGLSAAALLMLAPALVVSQDLRSAYSVEFEGAHVVIGQDRDLTDLGKLYREQFPKATSKTLVERTGGKPQLVWEETALHEHSRRIGLYYFACEALVALSAMALASAWRSRAPGRGEIRAMRASEPAIGPVEAPLARRFRVALSFPGEVRDRAGGIASELEAALGRDHVFYDAWYRAELARPNLDLYLQDIYQSQSELLVVLLCADYDRKEWCGLEWRVVRELIKGKESHRIMFMRLDDAPLPGLLSIDGYLDIVRLSDQDAAAAVLSRLQGEPVRDAAPVDPVTATSAR